jgi:hypothetical protein
MNLVFAAGILVPQMFLGQNYFRGVKDKYSDALFPPVAGLGDIATRAKQLAAEIQQKFLPGRST